MEKGVLSLEFGGGGTLQRIGGGGARVPLVLSGVFYI